MLIIMKQPQNPVTDIEIPPPGTCLFSPPIVWYLVVVDD